jgi:hypothetical protein
MQPPMLTHPPVLAVSSPSDPDLDPTPSLAMVKCRFRERFEATERGSEMRGQLPRPSNPKRAAGALKKTMAFIKKFSVMTGAYFDVVFSVTGDRIGAGVYWGERARDHRQTDSSGTDAALGGRSTGLTWGGCRRVGGSKSRAKRSGACSQGQRQGPAADSKAEAIRWTSARSRRPGSFLISRR